MSYVELLSVGNALNVVKLLFSDVPFNNHHHPFRRHQIFRRRTVRTIPDTIYFALQRIAYTNGNLKVTQ